MFDRSRLGLRESFAQKGMKFMNSEKTNLPPLRLSKTGVSWPITYKAAEGGAIKFN
jgi:hypothetical protein